MAAISRVGAPGGQQGPWGAVRLSPETPEEVPSAETQSLGTRGPCRRVPLPPDAPFTPSKAPVPSCRSGPVRVCSGGFPRGCTQVSLFWDRGQGHAGRTGRGFRPHPGSWVPAPRSLGLSRAAFLPRTRVFKSPVLIKIKVPLRSPSRGATLWTGVCSPPGAPGTQEHRSQLGVPAEVSPVASNPLGQRELRGKRVAGDVRSVARPLLGSSGLHYLLRQLPGDSRGLVFSPRASEVHPACASGPLGCDRHRVVRHTEPLHFCPYLAPPPALASPREVFQQRQLPGRLRAALSAGALGLAAPGGDC